MRRNSAQFNGTIKKLLLCMVVVSFFMPVYAQNFVKKVACVGNSITEGYGRDNGNSYPNQLDVLLGDQYDVRNFGVGGRTLLKNGDYSYWNETMFEMAQDFEPDIVIILLGTNDSKPQNWAFKDEFYFDYVNMVNVFRSLGSEPEIFVGFPLPVFQDGWGISDSVVHNEIIPLIDSVRTALHTFHVNFYDNMTEMSDLFPDGIHPNAEGYGEMAKIAAEAIRVRPSGVIKCFFADPYVIEEGEIATLYWEASDSSVVTLDNQLVEIKDSLTVSPLETTEFTLIASGEFQDTCTIQITFLPSGLIKSFYAKSPILEKDADDSTVIYWEATNNSQVRLDGNEVARIDSMIITPDETVTYTLVAAGAVTDTGLVTIEVLNANEINRSLLALSYGASSTEYRYSVESAFDNDTSTHWLSDGHAAEWISADLGKELYINRIKIDWGDVYATLYRIEILDEPGNMVVFYSTASADGEIDDIEGDAVKGRQVRLLCLKSSSGSEGYKIKELEIYGSSKAGDTGLETISIVPKEFNLSQNYPNPFNLTTVISYQLPVINEVDLSIYNSLGQKVCTLVSEKQVAGNYSVQWDARDYPSGVYFFKLSTDQERAQTRKFVLLK